MPAKICLTQSDGIREIKPMIEKLTALRAELKRQQLDAFIVPMADEYQNEYVPPAARRIEYLTGFTGSAGVAVVLVEKAAFFTDSRYTLQAAAEVPAALYEQHDTATILPRAWLAAALPEGGRVGYDPWLHSVQGIEQLRTALPTLVLVPVAQNPVDAIWHEKPAASFSAVTAYPLDFAGQGSAEKRAVLAKPLAQNQVAAVVLTDPASTAWLLNMRGADVPYTPLPLGFAILQQDASVQWFIAPSRLDQTAQDALDKDVVCLPPEEFLPMLDRLGTTRKKVQLDPALCAAIIAERLTKAGAEIVHADDPCALPRALKNPTEQEGMRRAHQRDGVALAEFFAWLSAQPHGSVTELQAEAQLEAARSRQEKYRGPSFATIAGSGAHGAIVHYRATAATDRALQAGELFLLDSGGQYLDGTTDVTRTVAIGTPSAAMREHYTRVVKGHISLATIRFPAGTTGAELDVLARQYLWVAGLDYGHGTGHGVGCYLGVHEGPQGISRRSKVALQPGMVLSNEPGFYLAGQYGIRFENLMLVTAPETPPGGTIPMLGFATLTLAPLDHSLLCRDLLTSPERDWINAYHARIREHILPHLSPSAARWLTEQTKPL